MRAAFPLVLIAGLLLAGFATWKTAQYVNRNEAITRNALSQVVPTVEILVAKTDLPFGHVLQPKDVQRIAWPQAALPKTAFTDPAKLFPEGGQNRLVLRPMEAMEPILASKVTEPGEDAGLNTRIAAGMRAFTIQVDATTGVSGFIRPGDRVDVYWTGAASGATPDFQDEVTKLIETSIHVVAIDQTADSERTGATLARTVTVEITPQQVARLAQGQMTGRLSLSLVGVQDDGKAEVEDVTKRGLLDIVMPQTTSPILQQENCTVRTRKGTEVVEMPIPCGS